MREKNWVQNKGAKRQRHKHDETEDMAFRGSNGARGPDCARMLVRSIPLPASEAPAGERVG